MWRAVSRLSSFLMVTFADADSCSSQTMVPCVMSNLGACVLLGGAIQDLCVHGRDLKRSLQALMHEYVTPQLVVQYRHRACLYRKQCSRCSRGVLLACGQYSKGSAVICSLEHVAPLPTEVSCNRCQQAVSVVS